jgi:hypothetical protein
MNQRKSRRKSSPGRGHKEMSYGMRVYKASKRNGKGESEISKGRNQTMQDNTGHV